MKTINKPDDNLGGALKLYAVPPALVSSIEAGVMTLSATTGVWEIYFTPGTCIVDLEHVPSSKDRAGGYHQNKITAFVPKISQDVDTELEDMRSRRFVVVVLDGNEQYWVYGTATTPLKFSYTAGTGADTAERNGYTFTFEGKSIRAPMNIEDPF